MIDLRYHVVSLAAVLLALAVGVTLGAGPLRDPVAAMASSQELQERASTATTERDGARAAVASFDAAAAGLAATAATSDGGALTGRGVLIVVLPGVPASQVARVSGAVTEAGAEVTGTLRLTDGWVDPARATFRSALAAQVEPLLADAPAPRAEPHGDAGLLGAGLGAALLRPADGEAAVSAGTTGTVLGVLTGGELGALEPPVPEAADAAVVVAAGAADVTVEGWVDVVAGLAARGPVVVVEEVVPVAAAGSVPGAEPADDAAVVVHVRERAAAEPAGAAALASTVDALGADVGPWAGVLAVAAALEGRQGDYGLLDTADGPLPASG